MCICQEKKTTLIWHPRWLSGSNKSFVRFRQNSSAYYVSFSYLKCDFLEGKVCCHCMFRLLACNYIHLNTKWHQNWLLFCLLVCCFTPPVNSYGHVRLTCDPEHALRVQALAFLAINLYTVSTLLSLTRYMYSDRSIIKIQIHYEFEYYRQMCLASLFNCVLYHHENMPI